MTYLVSFVYSFNLISSANGIERSSEWFYFTYLSVNRWTINWIKLLIQIYRIDCLLILLLLIIITILISSIYSIWLPIWQRNFHRLLALQILVLVRIWETHTLYIRILCVLIHNQVTYFYLAIWMIILYSWIFKSITTIYVCICILLKRLLFLIQEGIIPRCFEFILWTIC